MAPEQIIIGDSFSNSRLTIRLEENPLISNGHININDELLEAINRCKTLIILNQVKRAQKVYEAIKSMLELNDQQVVLLHSRFTREDRNKHANKSLSLLSHKEGGKIIIPEGAGVVVATQVLEAGIDFSAELLLTEVAPADSLIQRSGRCARYEGECGEMIVFPVEDDQGHLPYEKEYLLKAYEWLQNNRCFNIKNFNEVCSFVDKTLDYQANDYEATDTLIDLYECVLYADESPKNIQLRKGKPVTLIVLEIPEGSGEKVKRKIQDVIKGNKDILKNNSIDIDIGVAWKLFKDKNIPIQWEIQWRYNHQNKKNELTLINLFGNRKKAEDEDGRISPFKTYIINSKYYDHDKGIYPDDSYIV